MKAFFLLFVPAFLGLIILGVAGAEASSRTALVTGTPARKTAPTNAQGSSSSFKPQVRPHPEQLSRRALVAYQKLGGDLRNLEPMMNASIDFYGKIVDENGKPVASATATFNWMGWSSEERPDVKVQSDNDGLFSITGKRGKGVLVFVSKGGYYTPKEQRFRFEYGDQRDQDFHRPDPTAPVVFQLKKKGKAEPLIDISFPDFAKILQLPKDGTPIELDLVKGMIVPAGQGHLKVEFRADQKDKTVKRFDWTSRLSVNGGGLVGATGELEFEAPETGYEPSVEIANKSVSRGERWVPEVKRTYFFKLNDGRFGRFEFFLLARNGVYRVQSFMNPSGSRNLEFDPAVQPRRAHFE